MDETSSSIDATVFLNPPTPDPSQEGIRQADARHQFPSLEGSGVGSVPKLPPRDPPVRFRKTVPTCWIGLELIEGKNRQVRRMTAAIGHPTLRLLRMRIGKLSLRDLHPGGWKELSGMERSLAIA
jgi:pseudouridine synthase